MWLAAERAGLLAQEGGKPLVIADISTGLPSDEVFVRLISDSRMVVHLA